MKLTKEEPTKEEIMQVIENAIKEGLIENVTKEKEGLIVKVIPRNKIEYDFSKVNLKNLSKKQLIRIIYDLKERLDIYETN